MQVDYLVVADAAAAVEGKHYILGAGWDVIIATSFPVAQPMMGVAVRLRVPWNDTNVPHLIELDVVDADMNSILPNPPGPVRGHMNVGRPPHVAPGNDQAIPLAFSLAGLQFQRPGTYSVVFRIEGLEAARSPFYVAYAPGAEPGG